MSRGIGFDVDCIYDGETIHAVGTIEPGEAATGPTYDCGGTPGCGPEIDECVLTDESGNTIEDPDGKILEAIEDQIFESVEDEGEDPDEENDARRNGD